MRVVNGSLMVCLAYSKITIIIFLKRSIVEDRVLPYYPGISSLTSACWRSPL